MSDAREGSPDDHAGGPPTAPHGTAEAPTVVAITHAPPPSGSGGAVTAPDVTAALSSAPLLALNAYTRAAGVERPTAASTVPVAGSIDTDDTTGAPDMDARHSSAPLEPLSAVIRPFTSPNATTRVRRAPRPRRRSASAGEVDARPPAKVTHAPAAADHAAVPASSVRAHTLALVPDAYAYTTARPSALSAGDGMDAAPATSSTSHAAARLLTSSSENPPSARAYLSPPPPGRVHVRQAAAAAPARLRKARNPTGARTWKIHAR